MITQDWTLGIVGGTGMLGKAIAGAILEKQVVPPERLWISNRSGVAEGFAGLPASNVTKVNQDLVDASDIILLSVSPQQAPQIAVNAADKLVISVMAGISLAKLTSITRSDRIIRAMSSPAARAGLAYSPWCASAGTTSRDHELATTIFSACGPTDQVESESHIDSFTAMTGPVPGFVAFFAEAMTDYAVARGIPPDIADRAVRQLFLGAGTMLSDGPMTPADHVKQMIDYAGTTAAGLNAMKQSSIVSDISDGLDAAVARTRSIG